VRRTTVVTLSSVPEVPGKTERFLPAQCVLAGIAVVLVVAGCTRVQGGDVSEMSTTTSTTATTTTTEAPTSTSTSTSIEPSTSGLDELVFAPVPVDGVEVVRVDVSDPASAIGRDGLELPPAFAAVGCRVFWLDGSGSKIAMFDQADGEWLDTILLPSDTLGLDMVADGSRLLVANRYPPDPSLITVDASSGEVVDIRRPVDHGWLSVPMNARLVVVNGDVYFELRGSELSGLFAGEPFVRDYGPGVALARDGFDVTTADGGWHVTVKGVRVRSLGERLMTPNGTVAVTASGFDETGEPRALLFVLSADQAQVFDIGFVSGDLTRRVAVADNRILVMVEDGQVLTIVDVIPGDGPCS